MSTHPPTASSPLTKVYLAEYIGDRLISVCIVFMVLEIICVGLRFVARHLCRTAMGLDDLLVLPSLVFCLGLTALGISQSNSFLVLCQERHLLRVFLN